MLLVQYESFCTKLVKEKLKGAYLLQDQSLCTKLAKIKVQGVQVQLPQSSWGVKAFSLHKPILNNILNPFTGHKLASQ